MNSMIQPMIQAAESTSQIRNMPRRQLSGVVSSLFAAQRGGKVWGGTAAGLRGQRLPPNGGGLVPPLSAPNGREVGGGGVGGAPGPRPPYTFPRLFAAKSEDT